MVAARTLVPRATWQGVLVALSACGAADAGTAHATLHPDSAVVVDLEPAPVQLAVGETLTVSATARGATGEVLRLATFEWHSSDTLVARATSQGEVTAVAEGDAMLSARTGSASGRTVVRVTRPIVVEEPEGPAPPAPGPSGVAVAAGQSIQAAVDAHPAGTTFLLGPGVHRRQSVVPKSGDVFRGAAAAGAAGGTVLDGEGVTAFAFRPGPAPYPSGVRLERLTITRYAPPVQLGAVLAGGHTAAEGTEGWVVSDCEVRDNATLGIRLGHRMQVLRTKVLRNGQLGVGGIGDGALLEGNEIAWNNAQYAYNMDFEAGGTKFVKSDGLVARGNFVHHNGGPGLWSDIDNVRTLYERNRVEDNAREGIVHEISYAAVIRDNVVLRNGLTDPTGRRYLWNAGIAVHASSDVEVYGNTVGGNLNGIVAVQQARGAGARGPYVVRNLHVHDNVITQDTPPTSANELRVAAGIATDLAGNTAIFTTANNRFVRNTYILGQNPRPFAWQFADRTEAEWKSFGHDLAGIFNH